MATERTINHWSQVDGGLRGSIMLRLGAIAVVAGALANLAGEILASTTGASQPTTVVAWVGYIVGLWLLAGGFFIVGYHPFFTRFAFLVGGLYALHGVILLVLLFTFTASPIPLVVFTVMRLVATLVFAFTDKEWLPRRTQYLIVGAVCLQLLKILCRTLGILPNLGTPMGPLLDATVMLILSASLFQLSSAAHQEEEEWAQVIYDQGHSDFADFNNPEHDWNKNEKRPTREKSGARK